MDRRCPLRLRKTSSAQLPVSYKDPKRYTQYGVPSGKGNMWYGTTVTNSEDMERIYQLPSLLNTFASIEPLLEDIDENISALKYLNWIIIGAETGHRKEKVTPKFEWIRRIVVEADYNGIPVFMKDSLIPIVGEKNMRRDYPRNCRFEKGARKSIKDSAVVVCVRKDRR